MAATPVTDMDEAEDGEKAIVRSVRFKTEQWDKVRTYCQTHGVKHGSFLRNAALKAAGGTTESDSMRAIANSLDRALERPVPPPAQPVAAPSKPKPKKRR